MHCVQMNRGLRRTPLVPSLNSSSQNMRPSSLAPAAVRYGLLDDVVVLFRSSTMRPGTPKSRRGWMLRRLRMLICSYASIEPTTSAQLTMCRSLTLRLSTGSGERRAPCLPLRNSGRARCLSSTMPIDIQRRQARCGLDFTKWSRIGRKVSMRTASPARIFGWHLRAYDRTCPGLFAEQHYVACRCHCC